MQVFKESIKVPNNVFMGGQQDSLTYKDKEFKFIIDGEDVFVISATGTPFGNDIIYIDEINKRVGINISEPLVSLDVSSDILTRGDMFVSGTLSANELAINDLTINNLTVSNNLNVIGDLFVSGALVDIRSDTIIEGDLSVSGNLVGLDCTCSSLILSGFILAQDDIGTASALNGQSLFITNGGVIGGDLTVSGTLNANINVSFDGVVNNLTVSNDAFIGNNLDVNGHLFVTTNTNATVVANNMIFDLDSFYVNGSSIVGIYGDGINLGADDEINITSAFAGINLEPATGEIVGISGDLEVTGNGLVTGDLTVSGTLNANIDVSFDGIVENLTVSNDAFIGNDLEVAGNGLFDGDLTVSGTLNANINVSFDGIVNNLTVSNDAFIGNDLIVDNGFNVNGNGIVVLNSNDNVDIGALNDLNINAGSMSEIIVAEKTCQAVTSQELIFYRKSTGYEMEMDYGTFLVGATSSTFAGDMIINGSITSIGSNYLANYPFLQITSFQYRVGSSSLIDLDASTRIELTANEIQTNSAGNFRNVSNNCFITSSANITLDADTAVSISSPIVNINVPSTFNLNGGDINFNSGPETIAISSIGTTRAEPSAVIRKTNVDPNNQFFLQFQYAYLATTGPIQTAGYIQTNGAGQLVTQSASSSKFKKNIRENEDECYDIVKALRGVKFDWKDEYKKGVYDCHGFIAEEIQTHYPVASSTNLEGDSYISQESLIPVLWSTVRKLIDKCEALEKRLDEN